MEFARAYDLPVIDHCEDLHLSAGGDMHEGFESIKLGLRGIPACSEDVMVARDILLAEGGSDDGIRQHLQSALDDLHHERVGAGGQSQPRGVLREQGGAFDGGKVLCGGACADGRQRVRGATGHH